MNHEAALALIAELYMSLNRATADLATVTAERDALAEQLEPLSEAVEPDAT